MKLSQISNEILHNIKNFYYFLSGGGGIILTIFYDMGYIMHKIQKKIFILIISSLFILIQTNQANESKEQTKQEIEMLELQIKKAKLQEQLRILNEQQLESKKEKVDTNIQSSLDKKIEKEIKGTNTPQESNTQPLPSANKSNIKGFVGFEIGGTEPQFHIQESVFIPKQDIQLKEIFLGFNIGSMKMFSPYFGIQAYAQLSDGIFSDIDFKDPLLGSIAKLTKINSLKLTVNADMIIGFFDKSIGTGIILGVGCGLVYNSMQLSSLYSTTIYSFNNTSLATQFNTGLRFRFINLLTLDLLYHHFASTKFASDVALGGENIFSANFSALF